MMFSKKEFLAIFLLSLITIGSSKPFKRRQHKRSLATDVPTSTGKFEKDNDRTYDPQPLKSRAESTTSAKGVKSVTPGKLSHKTEIAATTEELTKEIASKETSPLPSWRQGEASESQTEIESARQQDDTVAKKEKTAIGPKNKKVSLVKVQDLMPSFRIKVDDKGDRNAQASFFGEGMAPDSPVSLKGESGHMGFGQIPFFRSPLAVRGPMVFGPPLLPLGMLPALPDAHITHSLPAMAEGDVLEEGSETALIENLDPSGGVQKERQVLSHQFRHPFSFALRLPIQPMKKVLKDAIDGDRLDDIAESKVIDVLGRKMLLQKKILKHPSDDASHMYVSILSLQPLEDVDPMILEQLLTGNNQTEVSTSVKKQLRPEHDALDSEETSKIHDKAETSTPPEGKVDATDSGVKKTWSEKDTGDKSMEDKKQKTTNAPEVNSKIVTSKREGEEEKSTTSASLFIPQIMDKDKNVQEKEKPESTLKRIHHEDESNAFFRGSRPDLTVEKKDESDTKMMSTSTEIQDEESKTLDTNKDVKESHTENGKRSEVASEKSPDSTVTPKIGTTNDAKENAGDSSSSTAAAVDGKDKKKDGLDYKILGSTLAEK